MIFLLLFIFIFRCLVIHIELISYLKHLSGCEFWAGDYRWEFDGAREKGITQCQRVFLSVGVQVHLCVDRMRMKE